VTVARRSLLRGWPLVGWAALVVAALVGATLAMRGAGEVGLRAGIRATAGSSFALLLVVFSTSSANALFASRATKWLLANRRYLGVSFAVSQLGHLALIAVLATSSPGSFRARLATTTLYGGGLGYVITLLMVATSFDRTAAWVGRRAWRVLHTVGIYFLWLIFLASYAGRAASSPQYAVYTALLVLGLGLRLAAAIRRRVRSRARSQVS
jgi:DMSO/TMAO reductase YedYZ heme-binding membrane subunit